jgi:hypothetical protein
MDQMEYKFSYLPSKRALQNTLPQTKHRKKLIPHLNLIHRYALFGASFVINDNICLLKLNIILPILVGECMLLFSVGFVLSSVF